MKTITIGRSKDNNVVIEDKTVSGRHLSITQSDKGDFFVQDLNSTNGTFVNGKKIDNQPLVLQYNDIIKIGEVVLPWRKYFEVIGQESNIDSQKTVVGNINPQFQQQQESSTDNLSNVSKPDYTLIYVLLGILIIAAVVFFAINRPSASDVNEPNQSENQNTEEIKKPEIAEDKKQEIPQNENQENQGDSYLNSYISRSFYGNGTDEYLNCLYNKNGYYRILYASSKNKTWVQLNILSKSEVKGAPNTDGGYSEYKIQFPNDSKTYTLQFGMQALICVHPDGKQQNFDYQP